MYIIHTQKCGYVIVDRYIAIFVFCLLSWPIDRRNLSYFICVMCVYYMCVVSCSISFVLKRFDFTIFSERMTGMFNKNKQNESGHLHFYMYTKTQPWYWPYFPHFGTFVFIDEWMFAYTYILKLIFNVQTI